MLGSMYLYIYQTNIVLKVIFMDKRHITLLVLSLIFCIVGATMVDAATYNIDSPDIKVIAEEISPEPVEPGQDLTVKIRVRNDGGAIAENVYVKLNTSYPFYVKTESNNFAEKKTLCVGCSIDNTYYLNVDANAKSGLYPLQVEIYQDDLIIKVRETINIKIVGKPDLVLETLPINQNFSSGEKFILRMNIKNIGTGTARNIKVSPDSENVLMLGSNLNLIKEIEAGREISAEIEFIIKDSLEPDTYKFPIKMGYVDEQGNSYEDSVEIGINVLNRAEISFQSIKITPAMPKIGDEVRMEGIIENTGKGSADKVTVELIIGDKIYKTFIGQLKADDDAPFYFDVNPQGVGMQTATLRISYYDDFGLHNYETSISKEVGKPTNNLLLIFIVLAVIVGVFLYIKRKKAKK